MPTYFTSLTKLKTKKCFQISSLGAIVFTLTINSYLWFPAKVKAQTDIYCRLSSELIASKENLRQAVLGGNKDAEKQYQDILIQHNREVDYCRMKNWPRTQGIWLRLYPCDVRPGEIDRILDKIVNQGYNQVMVEVKQP